MDDLLVAGLCLDLCDLLRLFFRRHRAPIDIVDLLIDRHPAFENLVLVGGGSGHGFKHGPAVGRYAADLVTGGPRTPEPRFSLASKADAQARSVR